MTTTPTWSDSCAADPVPTPDDDGPWCASGLLPEQRGRVTDVHVEGVPVTTPAGEIRTAAEKIRKLVAAIEAPDLPDQSWHTEECADDERGNCPCIVAQGRYTDGPGPTTPLFYVADAETPECAAYIATMHPGVGELLAKWLATWVGIDFREDVALPEDAQHAIAIARAVNGGQP